MRKCEYCGFKAKSGTGLSAHIRGAHPGEEFIIGKVKPEFHVPKPTNNLTKLVEDLTEVSQMLNDLVNQFKALASIDFSALALLFGGQPIQASPKGEQSLPQTLDQSKSRKLSKEEKEQIRLLWKQSDKNRVTEIPRLSNLYQTSKRHICAILFNRPKNAKSLSA